MHEPLLSLQTRNKIICLSHRVRRMVNEVIILILVSGSRYEMESNYNNLVMFTL